MNKNFLPVILVLFTAAACTERIEVTLDETYTRLVVDGCITTDSSHAMVTLTKSSDYFYNKPSPRVSGATVQISDGTTSWPLIETKPGQPGIYTSPERIPGKAGKEYTLHIELPSPISGTSSFDARSMLNPVAPIDSVTTTFHADWGEKGTWTINLFAQEPGDRENYYLFNWFLNGVPMSDSIHKKTVMDDQLVNGNYMSEFPVIYIDNSSAWETLKPGDTVTLQMSGITKSYMDFILQVQMAGFNLPFFTGPPANIQGNIGSGGSGFFTAYSNSFASTIVR